MENRISWIDSARGMAFMMIIYSHIELTNELLMAYFSPIFLTTFFFVSGYLFNRNRNFLETIEQRFRTLMIPWFIYGLFIIFLSQIISFNQHDSISIELIGMFKAIRGENDGLWFLACLFVSSIPFYLFIKYVPKSFLLPLSLVFFIGNGVLNLSPIPWYIHFIAPAIFYMAIGYLFKQYEYCFNFLNSLYSVFILTPIYIVEVSLYYYFTGHSVSFTATTYIVDGLIITTTGILLCISISKQITTFDSLLIFIGSNSLLYFCLHGKVSSLLQKIHHTLIPSFNSHAPSTFTSFFLGILITISTALVVIVPVLIINKFFPWSIGRGFSFIRKASKSSSSDKLQLAN